MILKFFDIIRQDGIKITNEVGDQAMICCPFHDDKVPSMSVNNDKATYYCHSCEAKGNAHTWLVEHRNMNKADAFKLLNGEADFTLPIPPPAPAPEKEKKSKEPKVNGKKFRKEIPSNALEVYRYYQQNKKGKWIDRFVVARYLVSGKKTFVPYTKCRFEGELGWVTGAPNDPRPPYNLKRITELLENADRPQIVIVEGEKDVHTMSEAFPKVLASCWSSGATSWRKTDWSFFKGRKVLLISDADEPGRRAMRGLGKYLQELECEVLAIYPEGEDGRDVSDIYAEEGKAGLVSFINKNVGPLTARVKKKKDKPPTEKNPKVKKEEKKPVLIGPEQVETIRRNKYFKVIGYLDDHIVVVSFKEKGAITSYRKIDLHKQNVLGVMAPRSWWMQIFGSETMGSNLCATAQELLLTEAEVMGVVNLDNIVGRGATIIENEIVWNLGNSLVIEGKTIAIEEGYKGVYFDVRNEPLGIPDVDPLNFSEKKQLAEVMQQYRWRTLDDGRRFMGWIVCALIGGALDWRPHLWIPAPAGTGKSFLIENILNNIFGNWAYHASNVTEAALSRWVRSDSLPVIIEEAEPEHGRFAKNDRLNAIVSLARISAGGSGKRIRTDMRSGSVVKTTPRFSCIMLSTQMPQMKAADSSRFVTVQLATKGVDEWQAIKYFVNKNFVTGNYGERIRKAIITDAREIVENIKKLTDSLSSEGMNERIAKMTGALTAGWQWWVHSEGHIGMATADNYILDSESCLKYLMELIVPREINIHETKGLTVGDVLAGTDPAFSDYRRTLERYGFRLLERELFIAGGVHGIKKLTQNTELEGANLKDLLENLEGAKKTKGNAERIRMGSVLRQGIKIPYETCRRIGFMIYAPNDSRRVTDNIEVKSDDQFLDVKDFETDPSEAF